VVCVGNNCFTGDYMYFGCGHWFQWRDTPVWFHTAGERGDIWCPKCLIEEVREGRAVLDPEEFRSNVIGAVNFFYGLELTDDSLPF
jgi:hypothetical protein